MNAPGCARATPSAPAVAGLALQDWQIRQVLPHRPPVLQLDRVVQLSPALDGLEAHKALAGGDPMLHRGHDGVAQLAPGALIEALAQCCGLLLRLRWLAAQGVDLAAFAAGDSAQLAPHDIPRSLLADSNARFTSVVRPGCLLRLVTRLTVSRADMHRFSASAHTTVEVATVDITLSFPQSASTTRHTPWPNNF